MSFLWFWLAAPLSWVCYFSAKPRAVGVKTHLTFPILLRYKVINNSDKEQEEKAVVYQENRIPYCLYLELKKYCYICLLLCMWELDDKVNINFIAAYSSVQFKLITESGSKWKFAYLLKRILSTLTMWCFYIMFFLMCGMLYCFNKV